MRIGLALAAATLLLGGCAGRIIPPSASPRPAPSVVKPAPVVVARPSPTKPASPAATSTSSGANARSAGVTVAPVRIELSDPAGAARALKAFRLSCPALVSREDRSGLTTGADWQPACDLARATDDTKAVEFFGAAFDLAQIGDGTAFATGYYEPEIVGSRIQAPGYAVPIYGKPKDLVTLDLGAFSDTLKGRTLGGRIEGGTLVPYPDRTAIETGALAGRGLEIAWAADPIELFFLQVQGSGRLRLPDGQVMRIGYDGQNGRDYTGIGKLMKDRGLVGPGQLSMQGIMAWLRAHPDEGRAIMRENKSWVFFRELTGAGPIGALNVPVTARATVAADPAFVPLGAPVFLVMDRGEASGVWVAQDTGGAIKGANRFDTFWGAGDDARTIAGGMSARGTAYLFLPKGVLGRLGVNVRPTP